MKKIFLILVLFYLHVSLIAQNENIDAIRREYRIANKDSLKCAQLYKKVFKTNSDNNLVNAYKGAVSMMYADFVRNKSEKLKLFKTGKSLLDKAIEADKENPELILLRFTIQSNAPKILGYNKDLDNDKSILLKKYDSVENKEVKNSMRSFLMESKRLTVSEKEKLK